jgi:hypothetical protein
MDEQPRVTLDKVERVVKLAGAISGLIAGIIKIVHWVVGHWGEVTIGLESPEHDEEAYDMTWEFRSYCTDLSETDVTNVPQLRAFASLFEEWFRDLSAHTQGEIIDKFGADNISELRHTLSSVQKASGVGHG